MVEAFQLVKILDDMFEMHDDLALKLGVDKVKTLGDCYVACTGVLSPIANHAATMVKFGLGMHLVMKRLNDKFDLHGNGPKGKKPAPKLSHGGDSTRSIKWGHRGNNSNSNAPPPKDSDL